MSYKPHRLTKADTARLQPHLSNWNRLNDLLVLGECTVEDLEKLLQIEASTHRRTPLLRRLQQQIVSRYRASLTAYTDSLCANQSSKRP